jgi:hypothetical protein
MGRNLTSFISRYRYMRPQQYSHKRDLKLPAVCEVWWSCRQVRCYRVWLCGWSIGYKSLRVALSDIDIAQNSLREAVALARGPKILWREANKGRGRDWPDLILVFSKMFARWRIKGHEKKQRQRKKEKYSGVRIAPLDIKVALSHTLCWHTSCFFMNQSCLAGHQHCSIGH